LGSSTSNGSGETQAYSIAKQIAPAKPWLKNIFPGKRHRKTIQKDEKELLTVEGIFEDPPTNTDLPLQAAISWQRWPKA